MRFRVPTIAFHLGLACLLFPAGRAVADLDVSSIGTPYVIDFDNTVNDVNNGQWAGLGFKSSADPGELDSDSWAVTGWSNGNLPFSGSQVTSNTDYRRGVLLAPTTIGGMYAYTVATGNRALWFQPNLGDFEPGTITLKIKNATGTTQSLWDVSYLLYNNNDGIQSNTFNFSFTTDDSSYTSVGALNFTSTAASDGFGVVSYPKSSLVSVPVLSGGNLFIRWSSSSISMPTGSGGRDEFGLDNISITALAVPEPGAFLLGAVACGVLFSLTGVRRIANRGRNFPAA